MGERGVMPPQGAFGAKTTDIGGQYGLASRVLFDCDPRKPEVRLYFMKCGDGLWSIGESGCLAWSAPDAAIRFPPLAISSYLRDEAAARIDRTPRIHDWSNLVSNALENRDARTDFLSFIQTLD